MVNVEEELINRLRDRANKISVDVLKYPRDDYAGYMRLCGEYRGIEFALETLNSIKSANDSEE